MIAIAPISENEMTYEEAILYCTFCNHNGYNDWRLPTWQEYLDDETVACKCWYDNDWFYQIEQPPRVVVPVRNIINRRQYYMTLRYNFIALLKRYVARVF